VRDTHAICVQRISSGAPIVAWWRIFTEMIGGRR